MINPNLLHWLLLLGSILIVGVCILASVVYIINEFGSVM